MGGAGAHWRARAARVAVVVGGGTVAVVLLQLWSYAHADNPALIERSVIVRTATSHCAAMRDAASAAAVGTSASIVQRVGAINAQNDAVTEMVSTIRRLVPADQLSADRPADEWLDDWGRLVRERDAYARALAAGKPTPLVLPVVDGRGLVSRLDDVGLNCRVPRVMLAP